MLIRVKHTLVVPVGRILPPMRGGAPDTLTIDPVTLCTWANEFAKDANYGGDDTFRYGVVGDKEDSYGQFSHHRADISALPANATILNTSRHRCYVSAYSAPTNGPCNTILLRLTEGWDEGTLTWNDRPAEGAPNGEIADPTGTGWFNFGENDDDLMDIIQDAYANRAGDMNWAMRPVVQNIESFEIRSDDYADADFRPKLIIEYTVPSAGAARSGATLMGLSPGVV